MIGRRKILTGLMIALCVVAQVKAETIPFDYWYGRIIGRTQIQSIHDAYNDEYGTLTTSLKTGYNDAVSVNFGQLLKIEEASQQGSFLTTFLRPKLSAAARLGPRMRLNISALDWQDEWVYTEYNWHRRVTKQSRFLSDKSIKMLHRDIEYDPARSLYYYTEGMLLQPRNWSLDGRLQINIEDLDRKGMDSVRWSQYAADRVVSRSEDENDLRAWTATAVVGYGLSRKLQLKLGWELTHSTRPYSHIENLFAPDSLQTHLGYSKRNDDSNYRSNSIFVEPVLLQDSHHWASLRLGYRSDRRLEYSKITDEIKSEGLLISQRKIRNESQLYTAAISHTWISNSSAIPREQLLDDHSSYYGHRLAPGTFRITSSLGINLERSKSEQLIAREGNQFEVTRTSEGRTDRFTASSEAAYFSKINLDLKLRFTLRRDVYGRQPSYHHNQSHGFNLLLSYYSFRWNPDKRQSIGWNQISDIDYLFGPLMQPRDWRASISVTPPVHRWESVYDDATIFNFFKGESNNVWEFAFANSLGVCEGVEVGLDAVYYQAMFVEYYGGQSRREFRSDNWTLRPHLRWQPGSRFRVDFTASEYYDDYESVTWYDGNAQREHAYQHTWRLNIVYSVLI